MATAGTATQVALGGAVVLDLADLESQLTLKRLALAERRRRRDDLLRALEAARARRRRRARLV